MPKFIGYKIMTRTKNSIMCVLLKSIILLQVTDVHGMTYSYETNITLCFTQYYRDSFTSSKLSQTDECLSTLNPKVTDHINTLLCQ